MLKLPPVIGHRGLAGRAPENTLAAFAAARHHGLGWVELDTMLCASGELVVIHDSTVDRTSNGHGRVDALSLTQLRGLDVGSWFDRRFAGERIPLLAEVLDYCAGAGLGINIEIKPNRGQYRSTVVALAKLLHAGRWPERLPLLLSSFSLQSMRAAQALLPALPRGWLLEKPFVSSVELPRLQTLGCWSFHYDQARLNADIIAQVRHQDRQVLAWTVNDPARAAELLGMGVCSVFSDQPLTQPAG